MNKALPGGGSFRTARLIIVAALATTAACGGGRGQPTDMSSGISPPPAPIPPPVRGTSFSAVESDWGLQFGFGWVAAQDVMPELFGGGAATGDYDDDGDLDLVIVRGNAGPNLLFENTGTSFIERGLEAGIAYTKAATENYRHSGPALADIDGDGDLDLFIGGLFGNPSFLFVNNGDRTFSNVTAGSGIEAMTSTYTISAAFGDYDLDGDLDLALAHWGTPRLVVAPGDTETLWRNDSDASGIRFTSVSVAAGISATLLEKSEGLDGSWGPDHDYSFTPTFADVNDDGYPDLLMTGDFSSTKYFVNNQDGTFTSTKNSDEMVDLNGMGSAIADYDNDGDLDWFVSAIYSQPETDPKHGNHLYQNNNGSFSRVTDRAGINDGGWGWGSCFADFDNDGNLDIYQTNGWDWAQPTASFYNDTSRLFMNNGMGGFDERADDSNVIDNEQGRGVVCADFDADGDLDILLLHRHASQAAILWRNELDANHYLRVRLKGLAPNTVAAGARIHVGNGGGKQMREVSIGGNFTSQNPTLQHFGLGSYDVVERLEVIWPDGRTTVMTNVAGDQLLTISHPDL